MNYPSTINGIVAALYWKHIDLATLGSEEADELTRIMAEQISIEVGPGWGASGSKLVGFNGQQAFTLTWRDLDGGLLYPLHLEEVVSAGLAPDFKADPIDHLTPSSFDKPDLTEPENFENEIVHLTQGLVMSLKMIAEVRAKLDALTLELDKVRKLRYRAQLNFKQVTFSPVEEDEK